MGFVKSFLNIAKKTFFLKNSKKYLSNRKNYGILICVGERYKILKHPIRGSVGTGRRARLRILWWLHRVGSSPIFRTKDSSRKTWVFLRYRENSDRCGEPGDWGDGTGIVKLMYECVFWGKCHAKCNMERRKRGCDEHQREALYSAFVGRAGERVMEI